MIIRHNEVCLTWLDLSMDWTAISVQVFAFYCKFFILHDDCPHDKKMHLHYVCYQSGLIGRMLNWEKLLWVISSCEILIV